MIAAFDEAYADILAAAIVLAIDEILTSVALFDHLARRRVRQQERAIDVGSKNFLPDGERQFGCGQAIGPACGTRVVDRDIDSAKFRDRTRHQFAHCSLAADIGDQRETARALRANLGGDTLNVMPAGGLLVVGIILRAAPRAGDHDSRARPREQLRDRPADTAHPSRPGDNYNLARQFLTHNYRSHPAL